MEDFQLDDIIEKSLAVMQSLQNSLCEDVVVNQEMSQVNANSVAYQPFVKLQRLSATLYKECITKGFVNVNKDKSMLNSNHHPIVIDADVMAKIKETILKTCPKNGNVEIIFVPHKISKDKFPNSSGSNLPSTSNNGTKSILPPSKIVRYGVEDLRRDQLKKEEIKQEIWKQRMIKKVLAKFHEKEMKKEVLYRQKILTKFVLKHKEVVNPYTDFLICARKLIKGRKDCKRVLKELENIKNAKIRKYVKRFLKDLLYAMEEVPVKSSSVPNTEVLKFVKFRKVSLRNLAFDTLDPFSNAPLITDDQQLLECICGKPNCFGIHTEKFY